MNAETNSIDVAASTSNPFAGLPDAEIQAMDGDAFADALWQQMEQREPMLTCEQMDEIEALWERERKNRRMALVMLTKPWGWLKQQIAEDREFAVAAAQVSILAKEVGLYRCLVESMEQAHLWISVALCEREDMASVIADAEAEMVELE